MGYLDRAFAKSFFLICVATTLPSLGFVNEDFNSLDPNLMKSRRKTEASIPELSGTGQLNGQTLFLEEGEMPKRSDNLATKPRKNKKANPR
jgi:hypothetical protein